MGFSSTSHVEHIEERLIPIRDVFAAVFFFWIGLTTDPRLVVGVVGVLAVAVVLTTPTKFLSGCIGGRLYGFLLTTSTLVLGVVGVLVVAVVLTTPTKFLSGYVGGRLYGLDSRRSIRVGCRAGDPWGVLADHRGARGLAVEQSRTERDDPGVRRRLRARDERARDDADGGGRDRRARDPDDDRYALRLVAGMN